VSTVTSGAIAAPRTAGRLSSVAGRILPACHRRCTSIPTPGEGGVSCPPRRLGPGTGLGTSRVTLVCRVRRSGTPEAWRHG